MKKIKKIFLSENIIFFMGLFLNLIGHYPPKIQAQTQQCKVEVLCCNMFCIGTRQICHQNGNGLSCTTCGESTSCGGGAEQ